MMDSDRSAGRWNLSLSAISPGLPNNFVYARACICIHNVYDYITLLTLPAGCSNGSRRAAEIRHTLRIQRGQYIITYVCTALEGGKGQVSQVDLRRTNVEVNRVRGRRRRDRKIYEY